MNGWGVGVGHMAFGSRIGQNSARLTVEKNGPLWVILDTIQVIHPRDNSNRLALVTVEDPFDLLQDRGANVRESQTLDCQRHSTSFSTIVLAPLSRGQLHQMARQGIGGDAAPPSVTCYMKARVDHGLYGK